MFETNVVPDKKDLVRLLGTNDFLYGRSRYKALLKSLGKRDKLGLVIDIGCVSFQAFTLMGTLFVFTAIALYEILRAIKKRTNINNKQ